MRVCVFGSSSRETPKAYLDASRRLGELLAKGGHVCVTGAGLSGCMGAVNEGAYSAGGRTEGVIHRMWVGGDNDEKSRLLTELKIVDGETLANRKRVLCEGSDCFISLPGGLGTYDELFEVLCERQLKLNPRPVVLLNVGGFYDGIIAQIKRAQAEKILYAGLDELLLVTDSPDAAIEYCVRQRGQAVAARATDEAAAEDKKRSAAAAEPAAKATSTAKSGSGGADLERMAMDARAQSLRLRALDGAARAAILNDIAAALEKNEEAIAKANKRDLEAARATNLAPALLKRLVLDSKKLASLVKGIRQIAAATDPIGRVVARTRVSGGLELQQRTVPIGVLLVIFESRPDCLPQIASLAIKSGNGLLLKGGKEAVQSNRLLHSLIAGAIEKSGKLGAGVVGLVETRRQVGELLAMDKYIDLAIPRGSYGLVHYIKANTKIPVLGHADGICHVFIDAGADFAMALRLIIDAKLNYPAACNAAETLLLDASWDSARGAELLAGLKKAGIELFGGPNAMASSAFSGTKLEPMDSKKGFSCEYGDNRMTVEIVKDLDAAVGHINQYGSGHTDTIVTQSAANARAFQARVASACVFHNASTRFADGYRFGLGAEVGISTGKIHARGPVGVEGLTTTKWTLSSEAKEGHVVGDFSTGKATYVHEKLPLQ